MSLAAIEKFVPAHRRLESWVDGFMQYSEGLQSPELFRKWAAISAIAAAMERKIWIRSQHVNVYPHLYVFLVGPPGAGKTRAVTACTSTCGDVHALAKVSLTKAALMDELAASERVVGALDPYNSLYITAREFGAFMPIYDSDMLNELTDVYDGGRYDEKRRGNKDPVVIERPQINMIACTTPSYLLGTMPLGAWEQGFLSRVIIIYQNANFTSELNLLDETSNENSALGVALAHDMKAIASKIGRMMFTREAGEAIYAWNRERKDLPTHPRLQNYAARRTIHVLKLCMVAAADNGAENIDLPEWTKALDWLHEAEKVMPEVFAAMQSGGDAVVINEAWHYVLTAQVKMNGMVPVHMLYEFLQHRLPATSVDKVYKLMKDSKLIEEKFAVGGTYVAGGKKSMGKG